MSDVRVVGYHDISFWREGSIGIVVFRSNTAGIASENAIKEAISVLGIASVDSDVRALALTGMNSIFLRGIQWGKSVDLGAIRAFVSLLIGLDKPVFTIVNGDAINEGYEIAMLGDVVIASEGSMLGLSPGYRFSMCGSLSMSRSRRLWISRAEAGVNCDIVLPRERFLEDARSIMEENKGFQFHLMRRARFSNFREALDAEHLAQVT